MYLGTSTFTDINPIHLPKPLHGFGVVNFYFIKRNLLHYCLFLSGGSVLIFLIFTLYQKQIY